tara:strand:+ start:32143 stop:32601 length:459 start_codon:yes stop_codon:yes gene_type:complete
MANMKILIFVALLFIPLASYAKENVETCKNKTYEILLKGMDSLEYSSLIDFIRCRDYHDGGNLGDLYIQAGLYLEKDPFLYEYILTEEGVHSDPDFKNFFVMLPPTFVDRYQAQILEYKKREGLVKSFKNENFRKRVQSVLKQANNRYESLE